MKDEKRKRVLITSLCVLGVVLLIIGASYAWFTLSLNGTKTNVLKAGNLTLTLDDTNATGIDLIQAVPMFDEVGETLDPYRFVLKNEGDIDSGYTIYLDDMELLENEERIDDGAIKYQLIKNDTSVTKLLSTTGSHPSRVLDSGTIKPNETITYDLRLWIDSDAENDIMGQVFRGVIRIVGSQVTTTPSTNENILNVYQYSTEDATKCITGEESTCVELTDRPDTYTAGTIIKYQVSDTEEKYFYVMFDEGDTLTLQQRENTVSGAPWYSTEDGSYVNTEGPLTALPLLENATASWTNVKDQTYSMGVTTFKTNAFTGCGSATCSENKYTLPERTGKARMITIQETSLLGCKSTQKTCPLWMYNYLKENESYGGTETGVDFGYWTMSSLAADTTHVEMVYNSGNISNSSPTTALFGLRAVVVIDK